ncbi:acyl-[ACP]--phospholipid O-acyltransferase [Siculibacillus lacustris]|uniref:Acyl-[ACP]--phospholipid O-acyltransferase n=1 Tax=Siculibacillus lacustris TaxID=1549641 RepID=A0A4Q9VXN2_9HYPH|nr:acyl-[ACP]--phospholipid O-acyltransferase [Siculibacillus lacustris]TBW41247.1 acyl-[ACP]--phospholipid O-acyltransferase [Siculibacillus lacustris]
MSKSLLASRRFAGLFWCQFFSALDDNFLKNALVFLILFHVGQERAGPLVTLAAATLMAPFFFLSALGGELADRFDKAVVARRLKLAEIAVAGLAVIGFWTASIPTLFAALAGFGVIAALFGPIKYGILPDHLEKGELPAGNALIEGATFLAILLGTVIGGLAASRGGDPAALAGVMIAFAVAAFVAALWIPRTGQAAPDLKVRWNILASTLDLVVELHRSPRLFWAGVVSSWFWAVGAVVLSLLPSLVKGAIGGSEDLVTAFLAVFAVAIALGSGLAAWLSGHRIVLVGVPIAGLLIGVFGLDAAWTVGHLAAPGADPVGIAAFARVPGGLRLAVDLAGLAAAGGLFVVPVFAALQSWAGVERRARVVAAVNILNAFAMTGATLAVAGLQVAGVTLAALLAGLGALSLVVAVAVWRTLPTHALRDALFLIYRILFRLEVTGTENLENLGDRVVIALNHVSFLDAALALALMEREPVFAIDSAIAKRWWVRPFLRVARALPLDPTKPMATRTLIHAVESGDPLVIFPEGRLTVTGSLMKVYDGAGLVALKSDAQVVPVRLEGLEQTPFTRLDPSQIRRRLFPKVRVTILPAQRLAVDPALTGRARRRAAGNALYGVMSDLIFRTTSTDRTVFEAIALAAEVHGPGRVVLEDPLAGQMTYRRLLIGAHVLGSRLAELAPPSKAIGVMLPNANAAVATFLGIHSAGRVPAMINFTAGSANVLAAAAAAELTTIVTSRAFVEKGRLEGLIAALEPRLRIVYLEDVRGEIGALDKIRGLLRWRHALARRRPDDPVAILFTSGSEGLPKGVVLSSRNMLANIAEIAARIDFGRADKVLDVLPLFHSFGLTAGLVLPITNGLPVYLYPSPLHYRVVPELVYGFNATVLFGTDTFLTGYARAAHPYDFRSLRLVVAGAEPVKEATRRVWMEKFGLRILEGYGVTETAPVIAINTPMYNRFGTVGRILPGMEWRLDPVEGIDEGGRLFLRGPNVMLGYLRSEHPGVLEVPPDGWHDTGDIVSIDPEGYVTILGRAKRFAKIGGEMVSLAAIEKFAAQLWPDAQSAAAAVPDAKKGERIVLVTTKAGADRPSFVAAAKEAGLADLMIPAEVVIWEELPLLGTGKIDNVTLSRMVGEAAAP